MLAPLGRHIFPGVGHDGSKRFQAYAVVDDSRRLNDLCFKGRLSGEPALGVDALDSIAGHQTSELDFWFTEHQPDFVAAIENAALVELDRIHYDHVRRRSFNPGYRFSNDRWVSESVKISKSEWVGKD